MTTASIYPVVSLFQVVIHPEHIATLELKALPNRNALFSVNIPDGLIVIVSYPCEAPLSGLPQEAPLPIAVLARALSRLSVALSCALSCPDEFPGSSCVVYCSSRG